MSVTFVSSSSGAASPIESEVTPQRWVTAVGLAIGVALGLTGSVLPRGSSQNIALTLSSLGIIVAGALLAAWFAGQERNLIAVGFALLALAEAVVMAAGPASSGSEGTFAQGAALYVPALLLVSLPAGLPLWNRIVGILAAIPFAVHASLRLTGHAVTSSGPLASVGYGLLSLAAIGWIILVLRTQASAASSSHLEERNA